MDTTLIIIGGAVALIVLVAIAADSRSKKRLAKKQAEIKEREEAKRLAEEKYRNDIINMYGNDVGLKIINQEFFIGMTKTQVINSKRREPDTMEKEEMKTKIKETWIYGNKNSGDIFVFENEVLTRFKDR